MYFTPFSHWAHQAFQLSNRILCMCTGTIRYKRLSAGLKFKPCQLAKEQSSSWSQFDFVYSSWQSQACLSNGQIGHQSSRIQFNSFNLASTRVMQILFIYSWSTPVLVTNGPPTASSLCGGNTRLLWPVPPVQSYLRRNQLPFARPTGAKERELILWKLEADMECCECGFVAHSRL